MELKNEEKDKRIKLLKEQVKKLQKEREGEKQGGEHFSSDMAEIREQLAKKDEIILDRKMECENLKFKLKKLLFTIKNNMDHNRTTENNLIKNFPEYKEL